MLQINNAQWPFQRQGQKTCKTRKAFKAARLQLRPPWKVAMQAEGGEGVGGHEGPDWALRDLAAQEL